MPKKFAEEEKAQILARVAEIGAAAAARPDGREQHGGKKTWRLPGR